MPRNDHDQKIIRRALRWSGPMAFLGVILLYFMCRNALQYVANQTGVPIPFNPFNGLVGMLGFIFGWIPTPMGILLVIVTIFVVCIVFLWKYFKQQSDEIARLKSQINPPSPDN